MKDIVFAYFGVDYFKETHFGLLEAVDMKDAIKHLGKNYTIKRIEIDRDEHLDAIFDEEIKKTIVEQTFRIKILR